LERRTKLSRAKRKRCLATHISSETGELAWHIDKLTRVRPFAGASGLLLQDRISRVLCWVRWPAAGRIAAASRTAAGAKILSDIGASPDPSRYPIDDKGRPHAAT
jgi:hypothetical protein